MAIAVIVTFSNWQFWNIFFICSLFLIIGGSIGAFIAFRIPMTAMPELVAGYSLVGLSAVFVAISAFKTRSIQFRVAGNMCLQV